MTHIVNNVQVTAYCPGCGNTFPVGPMADKDIMAGRPGHCATTGKAVRHMVSPDKAYRSVEQGGIDYR
jgi:hypothetical protein